MESNAAWLGMIAVFSGLSMNLIVHFGFGIKELALTGRFGKSEEPLSPEKAIADASPEVDAAATANGESGGGLQSTVPVPDTKNDSEIRFWASAKQKSFFTGLGIIFITILFLWPCILLARLILPLGLLEYVFLFPACFLLCSILKYLAIRFNIIESVKQKDSLDMGNPSTGGLFSGAALFILLNVTGGFIEAVVLSLGFILGITLAVIVVNEIRRRSEMEAVPRFLRGSPLALIAMGLLSLAFSSAAHMLFETLRAG